MTNCVGEEQPEICCEIGPRRSFNFVSAISSSFADHIVVQSHLVTTVSSSESEIHWCCVIAKLCLVDNLL